MLSSARDDAGREIEMLQRYEKKLYKQRKFSRGIEKVSLPLKKASIGLKQAIECNLSLTYARKFYWYSLRTKYRHKKREICSTRLDQRKILRKKYFDLLWEDFAEGLPIKGLVVPAKVVAQRKDNYELEFKQKISANISFDEYPRSTSRWAVGNKYGLFVKFVDYKNKKAEVDLILTSIVNNIKKHGINEYSITAKASSIIKNNATVGYNLDYFGKQIFLPNSLTTRALKDGEPVMVKFIEDQFDPFNLVASMK